MAYARTFRSGNPALGEHTFSGFPAVGADSAAMTLGGTVNKTALSLLIVLATASFTWNRGAADPWLGTLTMVGFIVAMVTVFKQTWAPLTTPTYAALEGLAIGGISVVFEASYPGIVSQAVFLTFGTLGALLMAYRSGFIRATENFKLGVVAATGGIAVVYLVSIVLGLFGVSVRLHRAGGRARCAEVYGVVWRVRAAGNPGLAVLRDLAIAGQASGSPVRGLSKA